MSTETPNEQKEQKKFFRIISVVPVPPRNPFEEAKTEYIVLIQLWDGRPMTLRVTEEQLKPEVLKELVKKELEKLKVYEGQVVELD